MCYLGYNKIVVNTESVGEAVVLIQVFLRLDQCIEFFSVYVLKLSVSNLWIWRRRCLSPSCK